MNVTIDKLLQQVQRVKGKWQARKRRGGKGQALPRKRPPKQPPRRARLASARRCRGSSARPVSQSRPCRSPTQRGSSTPPAKAFAFRDTETSAISVIYRRPGGELTLVETES